MTQEKTKQEWFDHFYTKEFKRLLDEDKFAREQNTANWILGKEVRITRTPNVDIAAVTTVAKGIDELLREIGLDFQVIDVGIDSQIVTAVTYSTTQSGKIETQLLKKTLPTKRQADYASVVLTDKLFADGIKDWGEGNFPRGTLILALPQDRQHSTLLRNITKHETAHLFGYHYHHDDYKITGYKEPENCVMRWQASTNYLCDKCKYALKAFWKGIERDSGKRFMR